MSNVLTMKLSGKYKIAIVTNDMSSIEYFLKIQDRFKHLILDIIVEDEVIDTLLLNVDNDINVDRNRSPWSLFEELCTERNLLFEKNLMSKVYNSIPHNLEDMELILNIIQKEFHNKKIIRKELEQILVLNDIVYPRQVLIDFLNLNKKRWDTLRRCRLHLTDNVIIGAIINNIKSIYQEKMNYLLSGIGERRIQVINTNNLLLLYRCFILERDRCNSLDLIFYGYEKGKSCIQMNGGVRSVSF